MYSYHVCPLRAECTEYIIFLHVIAWSSTVQFLCVHYTCYISELFFSSYRIWRPFPLCCDFYVYEEKPVWGFASRKLLNGESTANCPITWGIPLMTSLSKHIEARRSPMLLAPFVKVKFQILGEDLFYTRLYFVIFSSILWTVTYVKRKVSRLRGLHLNIFYCRF